MNKEELENIIKLSSYSRYVRTDGYGSDHYEDKLNTDKLLKLINEYINPGMPSGGLVLNDGRKLKRNDYEQL